MNNAVVVVLSTGLLLAMVLNLALRPAYSARLTKICMTVALIGGLLFYGVGFAETTHSIGLSIIRTPFCVIRMFVGINDLASISGSSLVSTPAGIIAFWFTHLLAFYSMASAAMFTLGEEALRYLRMLLSGRGDLTLIYGINPRSIELGKECLAAGAKSVVFIAENAEHSTITDLNNMGMSIVSGPAAVNSEQQVLRRLRAGKRKLTVYALDEAEDKNLYYAVRLKAALQEAGAKPENTRLTLPGAEDIITSMLQVSDEEYGFGFVNVFDSCMLTARALIRTCPPWDLIKFGPDGRAAENFDCVVIGFGRHGQAALKQLIMNGQFAGSTFHAAVFSPGFDNDSGYMRAECPELFNNYDIESYSADGRSVEFYKYLEDRLSSIKLIAICTGDDEMNREISDNLMLFFKRRNSEQICVVQCGDDAVRYQKAVGSPIITANIYTLSFLSAEDADREAIFLNSTYDESDRSDWEKWVACDTFGKMSSRASADFSKAYIRESGNTRESILAGNCPPPEDMQTVLGQTEHLRWNAFHYVMGYSAMSREEFDERAEHYRRCVAEGIPCSNRITKDATARRHACLVTWDELDELSRRETEATGRVVDYKQIDINNVLALPELLRAGGETSGE